MSLIDELVKPAVSNFSKLQWIATGLILGFFLGFVDTLFIAAFLGYLNIQIVSFYFGIPTTFTGYFFAGMIAGGYAPREIEWEPSIGIFLCVELMMWGLLGFHGHGWLFLIYFIIIPVTAVAISHFGLILARKRIDKKLLSNDREESAK